MSELVKILGRRFARLTPTAREALAEAGLVLTHEQLAIIEEAERAAAAEAERVSFGRSAADRIVTELADSPFIVRDRADRSFADLISAFYDLRDAVPSEVTDQELTERLRDAFNGEAAGDADEAHALVRDALHREFFIDLEEDYELPAGDERVPCRDDGRWAEGQWADNVTIPKWHDEHWENNYE